MDLDARVKLSTLQWVRRLVKSPQSNTAQSLRHILKVTNLTSFLECKLQKIPDTVNQIPFYSNLFDLWNRYHAFAPIEENDIRRELIWNNKFITSEGKSLSNSIWEKKGVIRINDICQQGQGRLCSHEEITAKYDVKCSFLDALKLCFSVPTAWRRALTSDWKEPPLPPALSGIFVRLPGEEPVDILAASPKSMYKAFILQPNTQPTALLRWSDPSTQPLQILSNEEWNDANLEAHIDWEATYALPHSVSREIKIQSFHFRIAHRIVTCNKFLCDIWMREDGACERCNKPDTVVHFFVECPLVQAFWVKLDEWCEKHIEVNLSFLTKTEKVLGMTNKNGNPRTFKIINWLLLTAKFYIHRQRLFYKGELSLIAYLAEVRNKIITERMACRWEGKPQKFRLWECIWAVLNP